MPTKSGGLDKNRTLRVLYKRYKVFCKNNGSESKKVVFMNRDINACTNIRNITT